MNKLIYEKVKQVDKDNAEKVFLAGNPSEIIRILLGAAYYVDDWRWVQTWCLSFLGNSSEDVRRVAVVCLEHIARIHGKLDEDVVISALTPLKGDPNLGGEVCETLEGIDWFLHHQGGQRKG